MRRIGAFTLVELLIVLAVIVLLASLLLPVVVNSRKRAHQTQCISQLRQIGQAIQMYRQDHNYVFPPKLVNLSPYVKSRDIFLCPSDPDGGRGGLAAIEGVPTRYVTILYGLSRASMGIGQDDLPPALQGRVQAARILMELDPVHGVVVCFLHGRFTHPREPDPALGSTVGLFLRLQVDTSVKPVNVGYECTSTTNGGVITGTIPGWYVFSDVRPCPDQVPDNYDAGYLNCPPRRNRYPCPDEWR